MNTTTNTGTSLTLNVYKNNDTTALLSILMTSSDGNVKYNDTTSVLFNTGDVLKVTLETSGNPTNINAYCVIFGYY
jgi:hypothetical protein